MQAEELISAATAARAAWADRRDYREFLRQLQRQAAPYSEPEPVQMAETAEDRRRAAEFFKQQGFKTTD